MSKKSRILSLMLAVIMIVSISLTGCTGKTETSQAEKTTEASKNDSTDSKDTKKQEVKPVKLVWYLRNSAPKNLETVLAKANELISSKINATLDLRFINPGDYNDKMQMIMASSEEFDLSFTASWANDYLNNVSKGAYIPLDDLLVKFPALKQSLPEGIWNATKVNGKIYGVPNNQVMYDQPGFWFLKSLVDKYKFDFSTVKKLSDLTPIFQTIKDKEPDVIPLRAGVTTWFKEKYISLVEGFAIDTNAWEVYDETNTPEMLETFKTLREWNQKGFFPPDVATLKDEESLIKAGKIFSRYSRQKPGNEAEFKAKYGFECVCLEAGPRPINRGGVLSTLTAISVTSKNQEKAMALLDAVNTDKDIYNTLIFGLEGQDYAKVSENRIEKKPECYSAPGWMIGNVFNSYLIPGQPDDVWELTRKNNESAMIDQIIEFNFSRKNVENELAQINAVRKEFDSILANGLDDPEKILKLRHEKMKAAGVEKVLSEIKAQLDDWKKSK